MLKVFFGYREPHHEEWDEAVAAFKERIPAIAQGVKEKIEAQRRNNPEFVQRFEAFYDVCRQSINPNLSVEAVETMLIQHLMTERIFRRIFDNPDFTRRNVIALEIEKVIDSMTAKTGNRNEFLKGLDHFYRAIELAAESTQDYTEKQQFMNSVYERFFQGFSPKEADTHGIVYTPQPIVDFMVRSVEDILKKEFGRSLSDKGVHILDPFVGTGNFRTTTRIWYYPTEPKRGHSQQEALSSWRGEYSSSTLSAFGNRGALQARRARASCHTSSGSRPYLSCIPRIAARGRVRCACRAATLPSFQRQCRVGR